MLNLGIHFMHVVHFFLLLIFTCLSSHAISDSLTEETSSVPSISPRIVGGAPAASNYSWMVSLKSNSKHFCGGSLIAPDWVLTAAHCLEGMDAEDLELNIGGYFLNGLPSGENRRAEWFVLHEDYEHEVDGSANDIALIRLNESSTKTPLKMMNRPTFERIYNGFPLTVIGWGVTEEGSTVSPSTLQEVTLPFRSDNICMGTYGGLDSYWSKFVCAGFAEGGKDSCQGDSGGPMFANVDGAHSLVGVVSWGGGCARANAYGAYTEVSHYFSWIEQHMHGVSVSGTALFGFIGQGRNKPESFYVINNGDTEAVVTSKVISEGPFDFEIDSENWVTDVIPAKQRCEFKVNATGDRVGEKNGKLTLQVAQNNTSQFISTKFNTKVLAAMSTTDSQVLNNEWTWYTGHDASWGRTTEGASNVLRSGSLDAGKRSVLETYVTGKGIIKFSSKTSGMLGNVQVASLSASTYESDQEYSFDKSSEGIWENNEIALTQDGLHHLLFIFSTAPYEDVNFDSYYSVLRSVQFCDADENGDPINCTGDRLKFDESDLAELDNPSSEMTASDVCESFESTDISFSEFNSTSIKRPSSSSSGSLNIELLLLLSIMFFIRRRQKTMM